MQISFLKFDIQIYDRKCNSILLAYVIKIIEFIILSFIIIVIFRNALHISETFAFDFR